MDTDDAEKHLKLGKPLFKSKRYEEAEEEFRKTIQINPNFALAHLGLGILLLSVLQERRSRGRNLKARVLFEKQGKVKGVDLCDEILNNLEFADPMDLDKLFFDELYDLQDKF